MHIMLMFILKTLEKVEKVLDNLFLIKIVNYVSKEISSYKKVLNLYSSSRFNEIKTGIINTILPNFFTLFVLSVLLIFFNGLKFITFDFIGILFTFISITRCV